MSRGNADALVKLMGAEEYDDDGDRYSLVLAYALQAAELLTDDQHQECVQAGVAQVERNEAARRRGDLPPKRQW